MLILKFSFAIKLVLIAKNLHMNKLLISFSLLCKSAIVDETSIKSTLWREIRRSSVPFLEIFRKRNEISDFSATPFFYC